MALLGKNKAKQREVAEKMHNSIKSGNEEEMQQAWIHLQETVTETVTEKVKEDLEYQDGLYLNQKGGIMQNNINQLPFVKVNNYSNVDKFRQAFTGDVSSEMNIGDFGKGILLNKWGKHLQQGKKVDGSVITPVSILSDIIYSASQHSVLLGNCPVLPMDEGVVLIGKVKEDVELDFKERYAQGKNTGLGLDGITLEAKTLYAYVEIAEEDLDDIKNLNTILTNAFSRAIAKALDENFLYTNANASLKEGVYPKGILDNENIKQITVSDINYDMVAQANLEIAKVNGKANTIGYNPMVGYNLQTIKDSTGQYINPPSFYNELNKVESNGLKQNDVIVFDSNQILIGIRKQMDIKIMPSLETGTVIMRCMLRADVVPTREDHICKVNISPM